MLIKLGVKVGFGERAIEGYRRRPVGDSKGATSCSGSTETGPAWGLFGLSIVGTDHTL